MTNQALNISRLINRQPCTLCTLLSIVTCPTALSQGFDQDEPVRVTGGTFQMGTEPADIPTLKARYNVDWPGVFENESPAHKVTVSDFHIDPYEVTYARFGEFLQSIPEWQKDRVDIRSHNGNYLKGTDKLHFSHHGNPAFSLRQLLRSIVQTHLP